MKALAKTKAEPGIWMIDAPMPTYGHDEVLIKIKKTAICGTDIHIYQWDAWAQKNIPVPLITGHEFVGEIAAVGSAVREFTVGQRVSGEGHITCGICRNCRSGRRHLCAKTQGIGGQRAGAFAEYLVLPAINVFPLPDFISDDIAAIMDPFGNATHTALSFELTSQDVLVTGAGPIGIMAAAIAKFAGARRVVITDISEYRLALAEKVVPSIHTVNVLNQSLTDKLKKLDIKEGFEVGLEMSGNPKAFNQLISAMNNGGKIALLGILPEDTTISWTDIIFKSLWLKGIYGREIFDTWYKMLAMVQGGLDISEVITHHFSIDDYQKAFEVMMSGQSGKVILDW